MANKTNLLKTCTVAAIAAASLAGCALPVGGHHRTTAPTRTSPATHLYVATRPPVGPTRTVRGVPAGFRHDAAGARAAAIAYTGVYGELATAPFITRDDTIVEIATSRYAPVLTQQVDGRVADVDDKLQKDGYSIEDVTITQSPLRATVTRAAANRVHVSMWCVGVITLTDSAGADQTWNQVDATLVWERGDWHIDKWTTAQGPTPKIGQHDPSSSSAEVATVQRWPAATSDHTGPVS